MIWDQSSYNVYYKTSAKTDAKLKGDDLAVHADVECCRVGVCPRGEVYVYERVPQLLLAGGQEGRWTIVLRDTPDPESGVLLSSFSNSEYRGLRAGGPEGRAKVERKAAEEGRSVVGKVLVHIPASALTQAIERADESRVDGHHTTLNFIFGGKGNRNPLPKESACPASMIETKLYAGTVTILNSSHVDPVSSLPVAYSSANTAAIHEVKVAPLSKRKRGVAAVQERKLPRQERKNSPRAALAPPPPR